MDHAVEVGRLDRGDVRAAARILAEAFADNPMNVSVIGGDSDRRVRCNLAGMRALLPTALRHGEVLVARVGADLMGCLVATPPYGHPLPPPALGARLRSRLVQGARVAGRWGEAFDALHALHPLAPHWYLGSLGVAPVSQGQGAGRALLRGFLRLADDADVPAYLETDRPENLAFYQREGFGVEGETRVLGVAVWRMWRPASGAVD